MFRQEPGDQLSGPFNEAVVGILDLAPLALTPTNGWLGRVEHPLVVAFRQRDRIEVIRPQCSKLVGYAVMDPRIAELHLKDSLADAEGLSGNSRHVLLSEFAGSDDCYR